MALTLFMFTYGGGHKCLKMWLRYIWMILRKTAQGKIHNWPANNFQRWRRRDSNRGSGALCSNYEDFDVIIWAIFRRVTLTLPRTGIFLVSYGPERGGGSRLKKKFIGVSVFNFNMLWWGGVHFENEIPYLRYRLSNLEKQEFVSWMSFSTNTIFLIPKLFVSCVYIRTRSLLKIIWQLFKIL